MRIGLMCRLMFAKDSVAYLADTGLHWCLIFKVSIYLFIYLFIHLFIHLVYLFIYKVIYLFLFTSVS